MLSLLIMTPNKSNWMICVSAYLQKECIILIFWHVDGHPSLWLDLSKSTRVLGGALRLTDGFSDGKINIE